MRPQVLRLTAAGQVGEALEFVRRLPNPTADDITAQSELEATAANRDVALRLAQEIIRRGQPPNLVARALVVSARIHLYSGDSSQGQQQFLRARDLANESGEPALAAYALGQHLEALLRYVSLEAAVGRTERVPPGRPTGWNALFTSCDAPSPC